MYFFAFQKHFYKALAHIGYYTFYRSASEYAIVVGNVFDKLAEWHDFRNLSFCIRFLGGIDIHRVAHHKYTVINHDKIKFKSFVFPGCSFILPTRQN